MKYETKRTEPADHGVSEEARLWLWAAGLSVKASYRVDEIALLLSVGERTVYSMLKRGDLTAARGLEGAVRSPTRIILPSVLRLLEPDED